MRKNEKITALYERLSRDDFGKDDDQQRESNSISNQKAMLEEFAARQGFTNIVHFTDDGISGTSRKIRSTFQSKGKSGKHLTGTVIYGYLWNEARDQWLVDPEAADVVKRIFAMTIEGYGPYQIASKLKEEKILIPSAYLAQHGEGEIGRASCRERVLRLV